MAGFWGRFTSSAGRELTFRVAAGFVVGAMGGLVAFGAARLSDILLFLIVGAAIGSAAALLLRKYGRLANLTEVKLIIPRFSELRFTVDRDVRNVAWKLFIETSTRVSLQPLKESEGLLREAMNSLYALFQNIRAELSASHPSAPAGRGPSVEELAITMLNLELRPFLSYWHPRLRKWELDHDGQDDSLWPENAACRKDLDDLRAKIRAYAIGYAKIAGIVDVDVLVGNE